MDSSIKRKEFSSLLQKGKSYNSPLLSFRCVFSEERQGFPSRFSFVVSGRISTKAIDRNLFKRRGRYIIRKIKNSLKKGFLGAFFAKNGVTQLSFKELEKEVIFLLKKSDILE